MKFTLVQTNYTATMHGSQPFIISDKNHHHVSKNKLIRKNRTGILNFNCLYSRRKSYFQR
jgi:hypothetical protein